MVHRFPSSNYQEETPSSLSSPDKPNFRVEHEPRLEVTHESPLTVVITNYKRPHFLKQAFDSCRKAGIGRIVVSSSGVDDKVGKIHKEMRKQRSDITILSERGDSGCNSNWLAGVRAASTPWVLVLHDDDMVLPALGKLQHQLDDSVGFYAWNAARHQPDGSPLSRHKVLNEPEGILPAKLIYKYWLIQGAPTAALSPGLGLFRRPDALEALNECQDHFDQSFMLTPTMMIGNDGMLWLRAAAKNRRFRYLDQEMVSFGSHPGSITEDEVAHGRRRLRSRFDRMRQWFTSTIPRYVHVVARHKPNSKEEARRIAQAEKSWSRFYNLSGWVEPRHVWEYPRDSRELGDDRDCPYLKDILRAGCEQLGPEDVLLLTNDDTVLHESTLAMVEDALVDRDAVSSFRVSFSRGHMPSPNASPNAIASRGMQDVGHDLFAFRRRWLDRWWTEIPDYVLAYNDWDSTLALLIRVSQGVHSTQSDWCQSVDGPNIPRGYVFHEYHQPRWNLPEHRNRHVGNVHNRSLTREFIEKWGYGWEL